MIDTQESKIENIPFWEQRFDWSKSNRHVPGCTTARSAYSLNEIGLVYIVHLMYISITSNFLFLLNYFNFSNVFKE